MSSESKGIMSVEFEMMTILDEGCKLLQKLWICDG